MKTYLEYKDGKSEKFWEVTVKGKEIITRWGKIGTDGQSKTKVLSDNKSAKAEAEKLIGQKQKKGYVVVVTAKKNVSKKTVTKKEYLRNAKVPANQKNEIQKYQVVKKTSIELLDDDLCNEFSYNGESLIFWKEDCVRYTNEIYKVSFAGKSNVEFEEGGISRLTPGSMQKKIFWSGKKEKQHFSTKKEAFSYIQSIFDQYLFAGYAIYKITITESKRKITSKKKLIKKKVAKKKVAKNKVASKRKSV